MTAKEMLESLKPFNLADPGQLITAFFVAKEEYYNNTPTLSDKEFDTLENLLIELGFVKITQIVGAPVLPTSKFIKRIHPRKMLSLNKVKEPRDLIVWIENTGGDYDVIIMFKYDGLAIRLEYSRGILTQAITRGDGSEGEDIVENVKLIPSVPHDIGRLESIDSFNVYGEIYMLQPVFKGIFEPKGYKNLRNAAAGVTRKMDESRRLCSFLTFTPYECDEIPGVTTYHSRMTLMRSMGYESPHMIVSDLPNIKKNIEIMKQLRETIDFIVDGLVIRVNDDVLHHRLGSTSHHPKGSMAFKFESPAHITRLVDVVWQTGATGEITPVAIVEPVTIDGVTIERINLHNYTYIDKLNLDMNCEVEVIRANDVIPQITGRAYNDQ